MNSMIGSAFAATKNVTFEYGEFEASGFEDRRVVNDSHVLSMAELMPAPIAVGWHETMVGVSAPGQLGSLLITPADVPFYTRGKAGRFKVARLTLRSTDGVLDALSRERSPQMLKLCLDIRCSNVVRGMRRLVEEVTYPDAASESVIEAIGRTIFVDVVRFLRRQDAVQISRPGFVGSDMVRIRDYLEHTPCGRITVRDLAALFSISERHFMRLFRRDTGETVHRFIERHRFEKAKILLEEMDRPLKQIAFQLGFASRGGFTAAFQRMGGKTPQQYRQARKVMPEADRPQIRLP